MEVIIFIWLLLFISYHYATLVCEKIYGKTHCNTCNYPEFFRKNFASKKSFGSNNISESLVDRRWAYRGRRIFARMSFQRDFWRTLNTRFLSQKRYSWICWDYIGEWVESEFIRYWSRYSCNYPEFWSNRISMDRFFWVTKFFHHSKIIESFWTSWLLKHCNFFQNFKTRFINVSY